MSGKINNHYIIACSKPWYKKGFNSLPNNVEQWLWVDTPESLYRHLEKRQPRYIFFLHWNWIVPETVWAKHECVCFHMTDLPYGRGGSPLQNLISRGYSQTKLSALQMNGELDAGPVYTKREMSLDGRAEDIYMRAGDLSFEIMRWMIEVNPTPSPQTGEAVLFKRRTPDQSEMPYHGALQDVFNHIRMLDAPTYPAAFIHYGEFVIEFSRAEIQGDSLVASILLRKIKDT